MPSLRPTACGRGAAVAGQHHDANMLGMQRLERADRALLDRIGDGDEPGRLAVDRNQHHALAFLAQRVGAGREIARIDAERGEKRRVADRHAPAVDQAGHPLAGLGDEVRCRRNFEAALLGAGDDRRRQRMLAAELEAGGEPQQFVLRRRRRSR